MKKFFFQASNSHKSINIIKMDNMKIDFISFTLVNKNPISMIVRGIKFLAVFIKS
jgi:gamma-glutamyl-gamma-aminobutyrate hydrolase PuuD